MWFIWKKKQKYHVHLIFLFIQQTYKRNILILKCHARLLNESNCAVKPTNGI